MPISRTAERSRYVRLQRCVYVAVETYIYIGRTGGRGLSECPDDGTNDFDERANTQQGIGNDRIQTGVCIDQLANFQRRWYQIQHSLGRECDLVREEDQLHSLDN